MTDPTTFTPSDPALISAIQHATPTVTQRADPLMIAAVGAPRADDRVVAAMQALAGIGQTPLPAHEVWLGVFRVRAAVTSNMTPVAAADWADLALAEYQARFAEPLQVSPPQPVG